MKKQDDAETSCHSVYSSFKIFLHIFFKHGPSLYNKAVFNLPIQSVNISFIFTVFL